MKNLSLRLLSVVAILAVLFSSCSKDSLSKPSIQVSKKHSTNDPIPGTGSVQAVLVSSPGASTSLIAINDYDGTTSEETYSDVNGFVEIDNLSEGSYTIIVQAYVPNNDPNSSMDLAHYRISIPNVKVATDQITDLGTITIDQ